MILKNYEKVYLYRITDCKFDAQTYYKNVAGYTYADMKSMDSSGTPNTFPSNETDIRDMMNSVYNSTYWTTSGYRNSSSTYSVGVVFGTGNVAPTADDYTLSGDFITGLSNSNVTKTQNISYDGNGVTTFTNVYTISNTTGADITIGEIALAHTTYYRNSSNYYLYYPTLYERTALEEPITIPAGGVGQVTYTISIALPMTVV